MKAVGLDFLQQMVDEAAKEATKAGLPLTYQQHDMNSEQPMPDFQFDLVINHAAAHHFGHIDFAMKEIRRVMKPDGKFVSMDYIGPHRNQYNTQTWKAIEAANAALPQGLRQNFGPDGGIPNIPTMLIYDPSEAHHSELIMATMGRYFFIDRFAPIGGAIAYPILTHNKNFQSHCNDIAKAGQTAAGCVLDSPWQLQLDKVMEADAAWLKADPLGRTLFAFVIATPLDSGLPNAAFSAVLHSEEMAREKLGIKQIYYDPTATHVKHFPDHDYSHPLWQRRPRPKGGNHKP
jgi:hypothetical protein